MQKQMPLLQSNNWMGCDDAVQVYTVSFFGHRRIYDLIRIERQLEEVVCTLLREQQYVEFLVGRDGDFDLLAASVIRRCKREYRSDNSSLVWVLPYMTADYRDHEDSYRKYYNEIEVFSGTHYKAAFRQRNRAIIERSDLAVFYVEKNEGGAYSTMKYATAQGVEIINLYDIPKQE